MNDKSCYIAGMEPEVLQEQHPTVAGTVICLPVRGLETALDFYRAVFGLPNLITEEGMITVELPGLSLFLLEEPVFDSYAKKAGRGTAYPERGSGVILSCAIATREELDAMLATAETRGGTVPTPAGVDETTGLYLGYFFDPDGHHWELAHSDKG